MKFEISTNMLINDIMSKEGGSVMLFAPKGSGKSEFLTALASRYRTTYWFSPATDDFEMFAMCLAEKILSGKENEEELFKMKQLFYAQSEFNDETVILSHLLDYVQNLKTNTLIVLEQMESAPKLFNNKLIEWLIRQCPKNLVIVVSSERFINFNFSRFEKNWPKLIDENLLNGKYLELIDAGEYIEGLSAEDVSFLNYITQLKSLETAFVASFYPKGVELLASLSAKGGYILPREAGTYRINGVLKDYLNKNKPSKLGDFWKIDVTRRLGEYYLSIEDSHRALKIFMRNKDADGVEKALKMMFSMPRGPYKLLNFIKSMPSDDFLVESKQLYTRVYLMFRAFGRQNYVEAIEFAESLATSFPDFRAEAARSCKVIHFHSLVKEGDKEGAFEFRKMLLEEYPGEDMVLIESVICALPFLYRNFWSVPLDIKQIVFYQNYVDTLQSAQCIWYVRAKEALVEAYLAAGHFKKAVDAANSIKDYIPFYVIPHKLYLYFFYIFDVEDMRRRVLHALQFSLSKGISTDRCLLKSALATIENYYGKISEACALLDEAAREEDIRDYAKFAVICKQCIYTARDGREGYAREVANTYLKYAEVYNKEYVNMMNFSVAFCAFKQGDFDNAYYYAIRSVKGSNAKDIYWLGAMAIATTCLLNKNGIEEPKTLISNIFRSAKNYNMEMMIVEFTDIMGVIMDFARNNNIEPDFIKTVDKKIALRSGLHDETKSVAIKFFGTSMVSVNGVELQWKTKKSKDLFLHYLLAGEQGMDRTIIIDLLWNGYMYDSAINNLKTTNNIIRKTLKEAGLEYALDYLNGKYLLNLKNYSSDFDRFKNMMKSLQAEDNSTKKMMLLDEIFVNYGQDFASDMQNYEDIKNIAKEVAQQKIIATINVIKALAKAGNFVDAKRFLSKLEMLDPQSDYHEMRKEIDGKININNENE